MSQQVDGFGVDLSGVSVISIAFILLFCLNKSAVCSDLSFILLNLDRNYSLFSWIMQLFCN